MLIAVNSISSSIGIIIVIVTTSIRNGSRVREAALGVATEDREYLPT